MKQERAEGSEGEEDNLFDLNEEPIERKRKRDEISPDKENENVSGLSTEVTGRVLRSRKMPMTDVEKQMIEGEMVKMEVEDACEVSVQLNKEKRRRRPTKGENENLDMVVKNKGVKINGGEGKIGNMSDIKRLKVGSSGNGSIRPEKKTVEAVEGKEMGLREQKKLLKEQIVAMLYKAGWTIEYKQRLSREYKDAIYVDREGRGYWSVTLAYKKLKERIDKGEATERDISAFMPIPAEKLSLLFRVTTIGMKSSKNKKATGKSIKKVNKKETSKVKSVDGRTKPRTRQTLLARRAGDRSDMDGYEMYEGKRSLLSWMIDLGTVPIGGKVRYKKGRTKKLVFYGKIVKDGICCDCCNTTHTVQEFESHAKLDLGKPYQNTYLESGNTLLQCLVDSWKKHVEINSVGFVHVDVDDDDPNDDACNICGDGGNLICCDSCPSTFHYGCLHIKIPSEDWHCVYCSCKFCGMAGESTSSDDSHDSLPDLLMCRLCEEKFHVNCTKEKVAEDFDHEDPSFCGNDCQKIFEQLQVLLGVRHELEEGFAYTVLQRHEVSGEASSLNDDSLKVESNAKLAVAFTVMDECFEPIVDERSGTNMIHSVVYNRGSNIRRLNYGGFYTIILEKADDIIAAASIRIHGRQLAEMPFIGTRFAYRRQGMCSRLLTAIETVLSSLGVEKLVIPAISELNETWTKVFGFYPLEESKRQEMKHMSILVFPKTNMLQKPLIAHCSIKTQSNSNTSSDVKKEIENHGEAATESSKIERDQNAQEKGNGDTGGLAASSIADVTSEIEMHDNDKVNGVDLGDTKSDDKFSTMNLGVSSENGNLLSNLNDNDTLLEVKVHDNDKVNGVDLGDKKSDTKVSSENLGVSSENGNLLRILPVNKGFDCNVEPVQCVEDSNGCVNGLLSVNSNGKSNDVDISGVEGEEVEGKTERQ